MAASPATAQEMPGQEAPAPEGQPEGPAGGDPDEPVDEDEDVGPTVNTFGSAPGDAGDPTRIYLADDADQRWSVHTILHDPEPARFDDLFADAMATLDEDTDLDITQAARNQFVDVNVFPQPGRVDLGLVYGQVRCDYSRTTPTGDHPRQICASKLLDINITAWDMVLDGTLRGDNTYTAAHEFGHTVGLRHSDRHFGVGADGSYVELVHDDPRGTVMATSDPNIFQGQTTFSPGEVNVLNDAYGDNAPAADAPGGDAPGAGGGDDAPEDDAGSDAAQEDASDDASGEDA